MTEDELLIGITDALTFSGWRWSHHRRSDLAVMMGHPGLPDVIAVHLDRGAVLAWELKTDAGSPTHDQIAWLRGLSAARGVDARIIRPADYDAALALILGKVDALHLVCVRCGEPATRNLDGLRGVCEACNP